MPNIDAAVCAMRERSVTLNIERARMAGAMRAICDIGGFGAIKAAVDAELLRLAELNRAAAERAGWVA